MNKSVPILIILCATLSGCRTASFPPEGRSEAYAWADKEGDAILGEYEAFAAQIRHLDGEAQAVALDELRLYTGTMYESSYFGFSGNEFDGRDAHTTNFVWMVYCAFMSDQNRLERAIIHTDQHAVAMEMMRHHVSSLVRMFPLSEPTPFLERLHFTTVLCRAYRRIPDTIDQLMTANLPRWKAENRIPALLFLSEQGDSAAREELDQFTGRDRKALGTLFRVHRRNDDKSNQSIEGTK